MDSNNYLDQLAARHFSYDVVRSQVIAFILDNKIDDTEIATELLIAGFLYEAHQRNEILNHRELTLFLGIDDDEDDLEHNNEIIQLDKNYTHLTLNELLEKTYENTLC